MKKFMEKLSKREKGQYVTVIASVFVVLVSVIGYTYSYFSAEVFYNNKSETHIKTQEIELIFRGTKEITVDDAVPGRVLEKTFEVENPVTTKTTYNIFFENITNEFNEDLVYTLLDDEDNVIIEETPLPETQSGKDYMLTNIEINGGTTQSYKLRIEFKYREEDNQSTMMGAEFRGTLGIDAAQIKIQAQSVSYSNPEYTECTNVECSLDELYDEIVG